MLWSKKRKYWPAPFPKEVELEAAIQEVSNDLFGPSRVYLDIKKKIGKKGKKENIPDGYLIDLSSSVRPSIYVVENELAKHHPIKHIALQILEFSLAYQDSPSLVKEILREGLKSNPDAQRKCQDYVGRSQFDNIDHLLDSIIHSQDSFQALVIIDELDSDLEKVLRDQFKFPVEIITLRRFRSENGESVYEFEPFLEELAGPIDIDIGVNQLDFSELDTVVVPARETGFKGVFMGENRWYKIRISSTMIPKLKYTAAYQVAPVSAITHIAEIESIAEWQNSGKYVVNFKGAAKKIKALRLPANKKGAQPQGPRYTNYERLKDAKTYLEALGY